MITTLVDLTGFRHLESSRLVFRCAARNEITNGVTIRNHTQRIRAFRRMNLMKFARDFALWQSPRDKQEGKVAATFEMISDVVARAR